MEQRGWSCGKKSGVVSRTGRTRVVDDSLPTPQSHLPEITGSQGRETEKRGLGQAKTALRTVSGSLESEVRGGQRHRTQMKNVKTETPVPSLGGLRSCLRPRAQRGRTHLPRVSLHCRRSVRFRPGVGNSRPLPTPLPSPPAASAHPHQTANDCTGGRSLAWSDVS